MTPDLIAYVHENQFHTMKAGSLDGYNITISERLRPLDPKVVRDIADSIKREGMLNPIIFTTNDGTPLDMTLVAGRHRLEAMKLVWSELPEAARQNYLMPYRLVNMDGGKDVPDRKLVELSENLHRKELSPAEREQFAAMWLASNAGNTVQIGQYSSAGQPKSWFTVWHEQANLSRGTALNRWDAFCGAAKLDVTPGKATAEQRQQFAAWLDADAAARIKQQTPTAPAPKRRMARPPKTNDLTQANLPALAQATGSSEVALKHRWRLYWKTRGVKIVPSEATQSQWNEFADWVAPPTPAPAPIQAVPQLRVVQSAEPDAEHSPDDALRATWLLTLKTFMAEVESYRSLGIDVDADLRALLA